MKRVVAVVGAVAMMLVAASAFAQAKTDFSGKWTPEAPAAGAPAGGGGGRGGGMQGPMTITQTAVANEAVVIEGLFRAAVESVEEAIVNSLCMAQTVIGRDGHVRYALPIAELLAEFGGD